MGKKQINVVSLSDIKPTEEDIQVNDNCDNNTVDEVAQIKEAIKEEEMATPQPEEKAKPKRKPAAKKAKVEEEAPMVDTPEPQTPEPEKQPEVNVKTVETFTCEKCGKGNLSKRTLRYTHPKVCPGQKVDRYEVPVKKQAAPKKKTTPTKQIQPEINNTNITISEEIIQNEISKRFNNIREIKLKQKEEKIKKLAQNIA